MSNKLKTLTIYDEFEYLPGVEQEIPNPELLALMLPDLSKLDMLIDEADQIWLMEQELYDV